LVVSGVSPAGPAYRELRQSDVIVGTLYPTKRDIASAADLDSVLNSLKRGDVVEFKIWTPGNPGSTRAVSVEVGR
jgi:S1-C subfamily serine protease